MLLGSHTAAHMYHLPACKYLRDQKLSVFEHYHTSFKVEGDREAVVWLKEVGKEKEEEEEEEIAYS